MFIKSQTKRFVNQLGLSTTHLSIAGGGNQRRDILPNYMIR